MIFTKGNDICGFTWNITLFLFKSNTQSEYFPGIYSRSYLICLFHKKSFPNTSIHSHRTSRLATLLEGIFVPFKDVCQERSCVPHPIHNATVRTIVILFNPLRPGPWGKWVYLCWEKFCPGLTLFAQGWLRWLVFTHYTRASVGAFLPDRREAGAAQLGDAAPCEDYLYCQNKMTK